MLIQQSTRFEQVFEEEAEQSIMRRLFGDSHLTLSIGKYRCRKDLKKCLE